MLLLTAKKAGVPPWYKKVLKRKLTAIQFGDAAGKSRLMDDEAAALKILNDYREIMKTRIPQDQVRLPRSN